jgi:DNA-directed RNA polymerase beta' subunit
VQLLTGWLQFHVATYMGNDIAGIPQALQKSGRSVKATHFYCVTVSFYVG